MCFHTTRCHWILNTGPLSWDNGSVFKFPKMKIKTNKAYRLYCFRSFFYEFGLNLPIACCVFMPPNCIFVPPFVKCNSAKTYWAVARKYYLPWNAAWAQINFHIRPQNLISAGKHETASPRGSRRGSNTPDEDNSAARWLCFCLTGAAACWGQNRAEPLLAKWTARRWLLRSRGSFTWVWSDDGGY